MWATWPGVIPQLHFHGFLWPGWIGRHWESPGSGFAKAAWKAVPKRECGSPSPFCKVKAHAAGASVQMFHGLHAWSLRKEDTSSLTNPAVPWCQFVPAGPGGKLASYLGSYLFHVSIETMSWAWQEGGGLVPLLSPGLNQNFQSISPLFGLLSLWWPYNLSSKPGHMRKSMINKLNTAVNWECPRQNQNEWPTYLLRFRDKSKYIVIHCNIHLTFSPVG